MAKKKNPKTPSDWARSIIFGIGGMNDYEDRECVVWNQPERVAAAEWAIRCLANPYCEGSQYVLDQIIDARRKKLSEAIGGEQHDPV